MSNAKLSESFEGKPVYQCYAPANVEVDSMLIEYTVASHLVINPVLDGSRLYLQFSSPGGGFESYAEDHLIPTALSDLVETFLEESELKHDSPDEYANAVLELEQALKDLHRRVLRHASTLDIIPDAFSPDFMPVLRDRLRELGISSD